MDELVSRKTVDLVVALALTLCLPFSAIGQQATAARIGFLLYSPFYSERLAPYRQALADLGWVDGRNLPEKCRQSTTLSALGRATTC
ncbi:MAG: hypothetical protein WKH97_09985 [Casimicrobiaceae bacterium]